MSFFEEYIEDGLACMTCHTTFREAVGYMRECNRCKQDTADRLKGVKKKNVTHTTKRK